MSDRHLEHEWQLQALQGREPTDWQRPAPPRRNRFRAPPASGRGTVLAVVALSLIAAGVLLVWHAGALCH